MEDRGRDFTILDRLPVSDSATRLVEVAWWNGEVLSRGVERVGDEGETGLLLGFKGEFGFDKLVGVGEQDGLAWRDGDRKPCLTKTWNK